MDDHLESLLAKALQSRGPTGEPDRAAAAPSTPADPREAKAELVEREVATFLAGPGWTRSVRPH